MYINGDILISPFICHYLIKFNLLEHKKRLYITSDRHNVNIDNITYFHTNSHKNIYNNGLQYTKCGQDIFLTSKNTFTKNQMKILKNFVVGRTRIDNTILGMALKDKEIITIDLSDVIQAIHLQYSKGGKYKFNIKKVDYNWNDKMLLKLKSNLTDFACLYDIKCKFNISSHKFLGKCKLK